MSLLKFGFFPAEIVGEIEAEGEVLFEVPIDSSFELPLDLINQREINDSDIVQYVETIENYDITSKKQRSVESTAELHEMEISMATKPKTKRSAKSQRDETKNKRLKGEMYTGYTRSKTGEIQHNKDRDKRSIKRRCLHKVPEKKTKRTLLCGLVTEPTREKIFTYFWKLPSWSARAAYLKGLVTTKEPIRRKKHTKYLQKRKNQSHDCLFPTDTGEKVLVCRTMLLNSLDLGSNTFERWTKMAKEDQAIYSECEDKTTNKLKGTSSPSTTIKSSKATQGLKQWLKDLPKVPSHYCRNCSKKKYVEPVFRSTLHIYKVYKNFCKENKTQFVSRTSFRKVLKAENIAIHKPRKDQCDLCYGWKTGNESEEVYKDHLLKKMQLNMPRRKQKNLQVTKSLS